MKFSKSAISKYLTLWTTQDLFAGQGRKYEWSATAADEDSTGDYNVSKARVCEFAANALNRGSAVRITVEIDFWRVCSRKIEPEDFEKIYNSIKATETKTTWKPVRDFQRQRVYNWEKHFVANVDGARKRLTDQEISSLASEITAQFNTQPVTIEVTRQRKAYSVYIPGQHKIKLAEGWGRERRVVLHEIAHHLSWGDRHGKEFVSALIRLYSDYLGLEEDYLLGTLGKIKYSTKFLTGK